MATDLKAKRYACAVDYDSVSIFSQLTQTWAYPFLVKGKQGVLDVEDALPLLSPADAIDAAVAQYHAHYSVSQEQADSRLLRTAGKISRNGFMRALARCHWPSMLNHSAWAVFEVAIRVTSPLLLKYFIMWLQVDASRGHSSTYGGWLLALGLGSTGFFMAIAHHQLFWVGMRMAFSMRQQAVAAVQEKLLRLNGSTLGDLSSGQVINLVSNDVRRFDDFGPFWVFLWAAPLELCIVLLLVSLEIGFWPALAGISTLLLVVPVQSQLAGTISRLRQLAAVRTDERVRLTGEVVEGILSVKMLSWESPFRALLGSIRNIEATYLWRMMMIEASSMALMFFCTPLVSFVTFTVAVATGKTLELSAVFYVIGLLNLPKLYTACFFIKGVKAASETLVSTRRINNFLLQPEAATAVAEKTNLPVGTIKMNGANFAWWSRAWAGLPDAQAKDATLGMEQFKATGAGAQPAVEPSSQRQDAEAGCSPPRGRALGSKSAPESLGSYGASEDAASGENAARQLTLRAPQFEVAPGRLVGICGAVGSGKSSLLAALLGELQPIPPPGWQLGSAIPGAPIVVGAVAYCQQIPWIVAGSVRDNIVFGLPFDSDRYDAVMEACALNVDIASFPDGDETEIGERGINLSGGQKARLALARAAYSQADIMLLDDPLSAVDPSVARTLFNRCIGPTGVMRGRTRVLVTHHVHWLSHCDEVIVMRGGELVASGEWAVLADDPTLPELHMTAEAHNLDDEIYNATAAVADSALAPPNDDMSDSPPSVEHDSQSALQTPGGMHASERAGPADVPDEPSVQSVETGTMIPAVVESDTAQQAVAPAADSSSDALLELPATQATSVGAAFQPVKWNNQAASDERADQGKAGGPVAEAVATVNCLEEAAVFPGDVSSCAPEPFDAFHSPCGEESTITWSVPTLDMDESESTVTVSSSCPPRHSAARSRRMRAICRERIEGNAFDAPLEVVVVPVTQEAPQTSRQRPWLLPCFGSQGPASAGAVCEGVEHQDEGNAKESGCTNGGAGTKTRASHKLPTAKLVVDEHREVGSIKAGVYVKYIAHIGYVLTPLLFLALVIGQAAWIVSEYWLSLWAVSSDQHQAKWIYVYAILVAGVVILASARAVGYLSAGVHAGTLLNREMVAAVLRAPLSFFHVNPNGRILNRFSKDQGAVDEQLPQTSFDAIQTIGMVAGAVIIVAIANPLVLAIIAPLGWLFLRYRRFYLITSREVKRFEGTTRSPVFAMFSATMKGLPTIRAYRCQSRFRRDFLEALNLNGSWWMGYLGTARWVGFKMDLISAYLLMAACLSMMALKSWVTPGLVALSLAQLLQLAGTMQWAVRQTAESENLLTSAERMIEYTRLPQERPTVEQGGAAPPPGWPASASLEFRDVSARYRAGLPLVLKGLSFCVPSGTSCGIVGRTGSGKSSLVLALLHLIPLEGGQILLDGLDVAKIGLDALRRQVAIISQDPLLFSGTLRSNLDPWAAFSDDRLWAVLEDVQLAGRVRALGGLQHRMAETGSNFSAGERQLLCLARALLINARVLALDEATANVDRRTDALIQGVLHDALRGGRSGGERVMLVIAHRIDTIMDCDQLLVLGDGQLLESGRPRDLAERQDGVFGRLVTAAAANEKKAALNE